MRKRFDPLRFPMILLLTGVAACGSRPAPEGPAPDGPGRAGYRAGGNEPFWNLVVEETSMEFIALGDDDTVRVARPEPERRDGGWQLATPPDDPRVVVQIDERYCSDSMSGHPFPHTVTVSVGGKDYSGCGGESEDLLNGAAWRVTQMEGTPTTASGRPTLHFAPEGVLAGDGGCNRYRASYESTDDGLRIGPAMSTRMACADPAVNAQELRFFALLEDVTRFDLTEDGHLQLIAGNRPLMVGER